MHTTRFLCGLGFPSLSFAGLHLQPDSPGGEELCPLEIEGLVARSCPADSEGFGGESCFTDAENLR